MIRPRSLFAAALMLAGLAGTIGATLSIARSNAAQGTAASAASPVADATRGYRIGALGTVEPPGGTIAVAPSTGGIVAEVRVAPGEVVAAGDVLFTLDDRTARARARQLALAVASREAALAEARGGIPSLEAAVAIARAAVSSAEASRDEAAEDLATAEQLVGAGSTVSRREVERRRNALRSANAQVDEAGARLAQAAAELDLLDEANPGSRLGPLSAALDEARAALATAEVELALLQVTSPVDATVLEVNVRAGEFAATGTAGSGAVVLGRQGPPHVRAEVEESDLPRLLDGAPASGFLRGGDGSAIPLAFVRREPLLRAKTTLGGGTAERIDTRVVEVVFSTTGSELSLVPGQLIDVLIDTAE
jgi:HlyD family secretion protein